MHPKSCKIRSDVQGNPCLETYFKKGDVVSYKDEEPKFEKYNFDLKLKDVREKSFI